MPAIAAAYGYLGDERDVSAWNADARADSIEQLWPAIASLLPR
jgi:phosphoglycolate phosphatase